MYILTDSAFLHVHAVMISGKSHFNTPTSSTKKKASWLSLQEAFRHTTVLIDLIKVPLR